MLNKIERFRNNFSSAGDKITYEPQIQYQYFHITQSQLVYFYQLYYICIKKLGYYNVAGVSAGTKREALINDDLIRMTD